MLKTDFDMRESEVAMNTVGGFINGMKTDFIAHRYPLLRPLEVIDGIRLFACEDIAAMKLNAITNRGSKKDFRDYAELLAHFPHEDMLSFFSQKYSHDSVWHVLKSLVYFDDAEGEPDPRDTRGQPWKTIKQEITKVARLK